MRETAVHFARNELDAETAASALRAHQLHPRVVRDDSDAMLGSGGRISIGRFIVLVPERETRAARAALRVRDVKEPGDRPLFRVVLIAGLVTALIVAAGLLAVSTAGR